VVIFLIFLFKSSNDESRIETLNTLLGTRLSVETLRRWRHYWINEVPQSHTWKRSALCHDLSQSLPVSLLAQFKQSLKKQLQIALKWLLPLTSGVHLFDVPFRLLSSG
jgi:hypothetical protein